MPAKFEMRQLPRRSKDIEALAATTHAWMKYQAIMVLPRIVDWVMHRQTVAKAEGDKKDDDFPLDADWLALYFLYEQALTEQGTRSAAQALADAGIKPTQGVLDQIGQDVVEYAQGRAAEMIGKRWVNGQLVDSPRAEMRIDESTRDMIAKDVQQALKEGMSADELSLKLQDNYAFSPARADRIAQYELDAAQAQTTINAAAASGYTVKQSLLDPSHSVIDICDANAAVGKIGIADFFPSGNYGPPYHNWCECLLQFFQPEGDQ